ncbi:hypothetical protein ABE073_04880 [Lederbergia citrisecunda]|uniref:hypothetical protein n=1 Tax=Lederbergia citrisecunda TaxID=2833583 RepID=UPI003D2C47B8
MKFTILNDGSGFKVDLGDSVGDFKLIDKAEIETLALDAGFNSNRLCIIRNRKGRTLVNIYNLKDYNFEETSDLLFHLINISKPMNVHIESFGSGIAVKDTLFPRLLEKGTVFTPSGKMAYGLDEMYGRLLSM